MSAAPSMTINSKSIRICFMKYRLFFLAFLICNMVDGQEKSILVFDLVNQTLDSITNITYDNSILSESTPHNVGCFSPSTAPLNTDLPTSNVFPGSQFTRKKRASLDFDLNSFPIRTSVKIFRVFSDSLGDLCSGSMISKRHVITAAHCVSNLNTNELNYDSLFVSPVFDNGEFNENFQSSLVTKVYFFSNWTLNGEDIALLELEEPIGELTGWVSIGFTADDADLKDGVFYKFSYPTFTNPNLDPNEYNGDTLYYNYGAVDNVTENRISITNAVGVGGDSGSSIIKVENGESYISYGVLSLALNITHSRINNWRYYAIKSIIEEELSTENIYSDSDFIVYPNPTNNIINVKKPEELEVLDLMLFDSMGRECKIQKDPSSCLMLDMSHLASGIYYLKLTSSAITVTKRIIKN